MAAIASCASAKAVLAGNQTLAAMVFQSEAQDKAKSTEFNAETSTRCCAGSGRGALELPACSSVFQALAHARARGLFHDT